MTPEKNVPTRMLSLIAGPKLAEKAVKLFLQHGVPIQYKISGMGTATSEMMDLLGLGTAEKTVIASILPRDKAKDLLLQFRELLEDLERKNRGIAFTLPVLSLNKLLARMMGRIQTQTDEEERKEVPAMSERTYDLITAIVNQGYSEEVMNAARAAGAQGGTVLHSRRVGDSESLATLGLSVQEEKEMILIVADREKKKEIMQAIGEKCGVHSDAKGVVLSLPIDDAVGLK